MNLYFKYGPIIIFFPLSHLNSLSLSLAIGNWRLAIVLFCLCIQFNSFTMLNCFALVHQSIRIQHLHPENFYIVQDQTQSKCLWFISTELNRFAMYKSFYANIESAYKSEIISIVSGLRMLSHIPPFSRGSMNKLLRMHQYVRFIDTGMQTIYLFPLFCSF